MAIGTVTAVAAGVGALSSLIGAVLQAKNNAETSNAQASQVKKLEDLAAQIQRPDFSIEKIQDIDPELADLVFEYNPESIPFISEVAPSVVEKSPVAQQAQQAQLSALGRFEELATTGEDAQLIAAREGAERESMEALSRAQAEREAMAQRRGLGLGSGAQMALQQADLTATAQRQQAMNEQAAADAALRRFQASQAAGALGGQTFGQEIGLATGNVGIINAFNQRQAMREQEILGQNVRARNEAALMAAKEAQRLEDENTDRINTTNQFNVGTEKYNVDAEQRAKQMDFDAQMRQNQAKSQAGLITLGSKEKEAQRTAKTISGISSAVGTAAGGVGGILSGGK